MKKQTECDYEVGSGKPIAPMTKPDERPDCRLCGFLERCRFNVTWGVNITCIDGNEHTNKQPQPIRLYEI